MSDGDSPTESNSGEQSVAGSAERGLPAVDKSKARLGAGQPPGIVIGAPQTGPTWDFIPEGYAPDRELERIVRLAAWTGAIKDNALLSYGSLITGFLLAHDPVSYWFIGFCRESGVDVRSLLTSKGVEGRIAEEEGAWRLESSTADSLRGKADSLNWPNDKPEFMPELPKLFRAAIRYIPNDDRTRRLGYGWLICARHLMAALAFDTPTEQRKQLEEWQLFPAAWAEAFQRFARGHYGLEITPGEPEHPVLEEGNSDSPQKREVDEDDLGVRRRLATDPATPVETLERFAEDGNSVVRAWVAGNPATPPETLTELASDEDTLVRREVAGNLATPDEALDRLSRDSELGVSTLAAHTLTRLMVDKENAQLRAEEIEADANLSIQLAQDPATLPEILARLASHYDPGVRAAVAENPSTPPEALALLNTDWNTRVRSSVFRNPGRMRSDGDSSDKAQKQPTPQQSPIRTLAGHSGQVSSMAFSPDGRILASGSRDYTVRIWDTESGALLRRLPDHEAWVSSIAVGPDGRTLASGARDGRVRLWDISSGEPIRDLNGHQGIVSSVAFSPNGQSIVSGGQDGTVRIWDSDLDEPPSVRPFGEGPINTLTFSPDGSLAIGTDDGFYIWHIIENVTAGQKSGIEGEVFSLAFSPDGRTLAAGGKGGTLRLWDPSSLTIRQSLRGHKGNVLSIAFSPDCRVLAAADEEGTLCLWATVEQVLVQRLADLKERVTSIAFSPDGETLATGTPDGTISIWGVDSHVMAATNAPVASDADSYQSQDHGFNIANYALSVRTLDILRESVSLAKAKANKLEQKPEVTGIVLLVVMSAGDWSDEPTDVAQRKILNDLLGVGQGGEASYFDWATTKARYLTLSEIEAFVAEDDIALVEPGSWLSPFVKRTIQRADELRLKTSTPEIEVRHLLVALVLEGWDPLDADKDEAEAEETAKKHIFRRFGLEKRAMYKALCYGLRHQVPPNEVAVWERILLGEAALHPTGFSGDRAVGEDRLDVTRYATALATVIASSDLRPPLSIGVFGDWGSGKSFFMHLLKQEIAALSESGQATQNGKPAYCRHIAAIDFNAWDYAETDLWASLVQAILVQLGDYLTPEQTDTLTPLLDQMDSANAKAEAAKEALSHAEEERKTAEESLRAAEKAVDEKGQEVVALTAVEVAATVKKTALSALGKEDQFTEIAEQAERHLDLHGLKDTLEKGSATVADAQTEITAARREAQRALGVFGSLRQLRFKKGERLKLAVGALVLLGVCALAFWTAREFLPESDSWIGSLASGFTLLGVALIWLRRHRAMVQRLLDGFDAFRRDIDSVVEEKRQANEADLRKAQAEQQEAERKETKARRAFEEAKEKVAEAEQALAESTSARRIAKFIRERTETGDYEKRLGITATIRKDFETLSTLMAQRRREREASSDEPTMATQDDKSVPLDRIVLYIDDLDRCPDAQVVKVLEAVHLLLAIPLFVVVVGVDLRWVVHSLHARFPHHLAEPKNLFIDAAPPGDEDAAKRADDRMADTKNPEDGDGNAAVDTLAERRHRLEPAAALDYVEKIFQIPFWLPVMEEASSRNLIASLIGEASIPSDGIEEAAQRTDTPPDPPTVRDADIIGDTDDAQQQGREPTAEPLQPEATEDSPTVRAETAPAALNQERLEKVELDSPSPTHQDKEEAEGIKGQAANDDQATEAPPSELPKPPPPQDLQIQDRERQYMVDLANAVGRSPRRLKRFVNAYRILKAAAMPLDRETFIVDSGENGEYRAAMALMAITTGAPNIANIVLNRLRRASVDQTIESFIESVEPDISGHAWAEERRCLKTALRHYANTVGQNDIPVTIKELHAWAPDVARFTFRSGVL